VTSSLGVCRSPERLCCTFRRSNHSVIQVSCEPAKDSFKSFPCMRGLAWKFSRSSGRLRQRLLHIFLFINKMINITTLRSDECVLVKRERVCCVRICASGPSRRGFPAWLPAGKIPGSARAEEVGGASVCLSFRFPRIVHRFSAVINSLFVWSCARSVVVDGCGHLVAKLSRP
jgi:hypothetical protein